MASIRQDKRTKRYLAVFRFQGRQYQRSLKTDSRKQALAAIARIEDTITLIERGRIELPDNVDPADFIMSDGRLTKPQTDSPPLRLSELFDLYQSALPAGAKEELTLEGERIHFKHLLRHLGAKTFAQTITLSELQQYVTQRSEEKCRGRHISVDTIRKELSTLRLVWNWALAQGRLPRTCPTKGIKYPKRDAKPPFMTWDEVQRRIGRGGLTKDQQRELWDCVFLTTIQTEELLNDVRSSARHAFIFPLFLFAAHTGARRSELLRSQIDDFDFDLKIVHIREKKRSRTQSTTFRRVPMSQRLADEMRLWFDRHPGGQFTISADGDPVTTIKATNHLRLTLRRLKWQHLRGYHVLRHSFASNAAAAGVDQGMIDSWMGHQTEEMRNRYRHLFPKQQQVAIDRIFGGEGDRPDDRIDG